MLNRRQQAAIALKNRGEYYSYASATHFKSRAEWLANRRAALRELKPSEINRAAKSFTKLTKEVSPEDSVLAVLNRRDFDISQFELPKAKMAKLDKLIGYDSTAVPNTRKNNMRLAFAIALEKGMLPSEVYNFILKSIKSRNRAVEIAVIQESGFGDEKPSGGRVITLEQIKSAPRQQSVREICSECKRGVVVRRGGELLCDRCGFVFEEGLGNEGIEESGRY